MSSRFISGQRPADTLNYAFLIFLIAITVLFYKKINSAFLLIALYSVLILVQAVLQTVKDKSRSLRLTYDLIFPTICILVIFDSLEKIVHYINPRDIDVFLIKADYMLFNGYPTVMLENIMFPFLTDILQIAYSSYYFLPITLGIVLVIKKDNLSFNHALFLIMLCFYLSYVGYLLWPALGPRYTLNHMQNTELKGLFLAEPIQDLLNRLEGVKRDAFPSGHTGIALTVLYLSYCFEKKLFTIFLPFVLGLIFSTVYLRYHYVVDVIAGIVLALITIILGERLYEYSKKRLDTYS